MRAVLQRVEAGRVLVEERVCGEIGTGLVVLLGVGKDDGEADARYLAEKIAALRIFEDKEGKINLSIGEAGGKILVVSQFTLYWDCRKGRRPSFDKAAPPQEAKRLYEYFITCLETLGVGVETGEFQATMLVEIKNHGPVTVMLDSKREF